MEDEDVFAGLGSLFEGDIYAASLCDAVDDDVCTPTTVIAIGDPPAPPPLSAPPLSPPPLSAPPLSRAPLSRPPLSPAPLSRPPLSPLAVERVNVAWFNVINYNHNRATAVVHFPTNRHVSTLIGTPKAILMRSRSTNKPVWSNNASTARIRQNGQHRTVLCLLQLYLAANFKRFSPQVRGLSRSEPVNTQDSLKRKLAVQQKNAWENFVQVFTVYGHMAFDD